MTKATHEWMASKLMNSFRSPYQAIRLDITISENYDEFRLRFETAVPMWDQDRGVELVRRRAPWPEIAAFVQASAPNDFLLYWKLDMGPLMTLAGNTQRATEYLMGNHVIAETMYRHNPAVALYVPLRCAIYEEGGGTRFSIEQPSASLSSLGHHDITAVGVDLDRKLAGLLAVLNVEIPTALTEPHGVA